MIIVVYLFSLMMCFSSVFADQHQNLDFEFGNQINQQLKNKLRMASYLLSQSPLSTKIQSSGNDVAKQIFARAKLNYTRGSEQISVKKWLEANAIIDSVLRDLTDVAQLLNSKMINSNRYHDSLNRLTDFTLPKWEELTQQDEIFLTENIDEIKSLISKAEKLAAIGEYEKGNQLLKKAYRLKSVLVNSLQHQQTIIYENTFASEQEAYAYMVKRTRHFLDLIQIGISQIEITPSTMNIINSYIQQCNISLGKAQLLEFDNKHEKAINVLKNSVTNLSEALRILGVKI